MWSQAVTKHGKKTAISDQSDHRTLWSGSLGANSRWQTPPRPCQATRRDKTLPHTPTCQKIGNPDRRIAGISHNNHISLKPDHQDQASTVPDAAVFAHCVRNFQRQRALWQELRPCLSSAGRSPRLALGKACPLQCLN